VYINHACTLTLARNIFKSTVTKYFGGFRIRGCVNPCIKHRQNEHSLIKYILRKKI